MRTITNEGYVIGQFPVMTRSGFQTGKFQEATVFLHHIYDRSIPDLNHQSIQELPETGLDSVELVGMDCSTFKTVRCWAASVKELRPLEAKDELANEEALVCA